MIQIGIRLHDVNAALPGAEQTMERRAQKAKEEGFSCVHLALSKVMKGLPIDNGSLTEGLAMHTRRVFAREGLDVAVLGCYLNLAHPDPAKLKEIQSLYYGHLRAAALMGAGVVGTETGAPNAAYKTDANTHSAAALESFIRGLAPVVACAERWGVPVAIEPVFKHIVYDADRALQVIKAIGSPNLRVIFDPVNLLCPENADSRERIFAETMDKLGEYIAVVHLKDFTRGSNGLVSVAAGTGEMDYTSILRFIKERKPYLQATLENTSNDNAVFARETIQKQYDEI